MISILCYGDSNTYGYDPVTGKRFPPEVRWTGRLQKQLGDRFNVIEEGCNGRTTIYEHPIEAWKNGLLYLKPCLNTHKPVDVMILMLGSNDLKTVFRKSAKQIAYGASVLVETTRSFLRVKQGFEPKIILVSPPEIGEGIKSSPFRMSFSEAAIKKSKEFPPYYKAVAEKNGCIFFNAAEYIRPSEADSLHLMPDAHATLADEFEKIIRAEYKIYD